LLRDSGTERTADVSDQPVVAATRPLRLAQRLPARARSNQADTETDGRHIGIAGLFTPVNVLWGPATLNRSVEILLGVGAALAGLGFAAMWLARWPTERRSLAFAMTAIAFVALGSLNQANPLIALMVCTALTVSGGYLAFFHTAPYMLANVTAAAVVGAVAAVRLALEENVILALWTYFLVVEINLAVPLAIQTVVRALGIDLLQSDRDPLTGLLNRRAFQHTVIGVLVARDDPDSFLALAMLDLDRFKSINDTNGHVAGRCDIGSRQSRPPRIHR
jgi:predicted signal transduction protein with EAL and GGDEF domain